MTTSLDLAQRSRVDALHRSGPINPLAVLAAAVGAGFAVWGAFLARHVSDHSGELLRAGLVVAWASVGLTVTLRRPRERLGPLVLAGTALGGAASLVSSAIQATTAGACGCHRSPSTRPC